MSDTKALIKYVRERLEDEPNLTFGKPTVRELVDALEAANSQLEAALQVNAKSQAEVTADMLNAMMAGITGQKETVHVQVGGYQCPYCNNVSKTIEEATEHDAICPKHPAVIRAEQAEAEVARLTKMVDWLANQLDCPQVFTNCAVDCAECRKEAARRAVAESEVKACQN